jgi:glucose-6-phosphate 1-epimerase
MLHSTQESASTPLVPGVNGLPKVVLAGPDGSQAEIYLHGAHLTSWIPAGGEERLFLSRASDFRPQTAIRGGVPVIFPQFSGLGPLPKHGFGRKLEWEFIYAESSEASAMAIFRLSDNEATHRIWPHAFTATLAVTLGARQLSMTLAVENSGADAFDFTAALHTYLRVSDIRQVILKGLEGHAYIDSANADRKGVQPENELAFSAEVDRLYPSSPDKLALVEPDRQLEIRSEGFPDAVVWNPWIEKGAALTDLEPEGYRRMLCVEAAAAGQPVSLLPSASWSETQQLVAK